MSITITADKVLSLYNGELQIPVPSVGSEIRNFTHGTGNVHFWNFVRDLNRNFNTDFSQDIGALTNVKIENVNQSGRYWKSILSFQCRNSDTKMPINSFSLADVRETFMALSKKYKASFKKDILSLKITSKDVKEGRRKYDPNSILVETFPSLVIYCAPIVKGSDVDGLRLWYEISYTAGISFRDVEYEKDIDAYSKVLKDSV